MRINRRDNFHVVVYARSPGDFGIFSISGQTQSEEDWKRDCEEIASQIRRHVDGLPSGGNRGVQVVWDNNFECSHCGSSWTEVGDYNGGCCSKDEENAPKEDVT